ncbi:MAG: AMP-binding protein, partial [Lachnospiraceae bacterium]|nr:AMP-binding protein [Lachnospiraceae bacterium]
DPESAAEKFSNGWMYTGDLAVWDERSYVTIRGRKDDMIIVSAENVYPAQIEEALTRFGKVADCIVTSVPDRLRGQEIVAYVVPADPSLTVKELNAFCRKEPMLSDYKAPRWYRFVDEIPLNATGKKLHREAKRMAAEDMAAGRLTDK